MSKKQSFWAARPFGYGKQYPMLEPGQVIDKVEVGKNKNDESLIRLGLIRPLNGKPVQCGKCGKKFCSDVYLNHHGKMNHDRTMLESGIREARSRSIPHVERGIVVGESNPEIDSKTAEQLGQLVALEAADRFAEQQIPTKSILENTKATRSGRRASR